MILNSYKLQSAVTQIQYANAFEIWDHAGAINRRLCEIWPDLKLAEGQPHQQILTGKNINIQTGVSKSTLTLSGEKALHKANVAMLADSYRVWCDVLNLKELNQVSTRVVYFRELKWTPKSRQYRV